MRFRLAIVSLFSVLLLCGAGCTTSGVATGDANGDTASENTPAQQQAHEAADGKWLRVADGIDRAVFPVDPAKASTIELYRFGGSDFAISVETDVKPKTVGGWAEQVGGEVLVVNGTYFHDDYLPSGFLSKDGVQAGSRRFDLDKSGLLQFTPTFRIINTKTAHVDLTPQKFPNAAQSYPFLIVDGKSAVSGDSGQQSRRTFVGQDLKGTTYIGVVDDGFVSLYGLTNALIATEVQWQDVLNLDGGSSTGLVSTFGSGESRDSFAEVPNVLVVKREAPGTAAAHGSNAPSPIDNVNQDAGRAQ